MDLLLTFIVLLALAYTTVALDCYYCEAGDGNCPLAPTEEELRNIGTCSKTSTFEESCLKYTIYLLNGDTQTYRSCVPEYLGGLEDHPKMCDFIESVIEPVVASKLISKIDCSQCTTIKCNT